MLVLATSDGIRLSDGASGWVPELGGHAVGTVVPDGSTWWALVDDHEVWRRSPQGDWASVASSDEELTCLATWPGGPLVGTASPGLACLTASGQIGAVPGFASAPTRAEWYTPWGGPAAVRSMAVAGDGSWFVNVHVGGVLRSVDGGSSWSATIDLHADVHQVICPRSDQPGLVLAACADGLAISRDAGASWRLRDGGLRGTYCRAVAVVGDTVVISSSKGPDGEHAAAYRAPLEGWARFEPCSPEVLGGNVDTGWLATDGERVAMVEPLGRVFVSSDEGASWDRVGRDIAGPRWLAWCM